MRNPAPSISQSPLAADQSLFKDLSTAELEHIQALARTVRKEAGQSFFRQNQEANRFYLLLKGRVKLMQSTAEGHQVVARYAGKGEIFGCVPLFGGKQYPAAALATDPCEALSWDRGAIFQLMGQMPQVAINALHMVGTELADMRRRYQQLATERVERRVARAVLRFVEQGGRRVPEGVLIPFALSRQELGEFTGTTLHTVSRILSAWETEGIVKTGRRRIIIRQPHRLVAIAQDLAR